VIMHSNRLIIFLAAATWAAHVLHTRDQPGRREEGEECYLEWRRCRSRWWRWCRSSRLWWWLRSPVALLFFFFFPVAETPLFLLSSSSVPLCNLLYYSSVFFLFFKKTLFSPVRSLFRLFFFSAFSFLILTLSSVFVSLCCPVLPLLCLVSFLTFPLSLFFFVYLVLFRPPRVLLFSFLSFSSLCFLFLTFPSPFVFFLSSLVTFSPLPRLLPSSSLVSSFFSPFIAKTACVFFYIMKTFRTIIAVVTVER